MPERDDLLSLARAIAAGLPVDWVSVESSASNESLRAAIRELKIVAEIAELHHGLSSSPSPLPESPDGIERDAAVQDQAGNPQRSPADLVSPVVSWGSFDLLERIGSGSFGEVYRARDTRLDREIALKLLGPDNGHTTAIIEEGRLLARVRHPNVVTVYGADRIDNRVGVWMEFIRGRTLEQLLEAEGPLSVGEATRVGVHVCRALAAVHRAGLVHRDIKAQNVMREEDVEGTGRFVLMDFGAGRERPGNNEGGGHDLAGTPLYLAPELFGGQPATVRSDIYSVGVLLYHLLSGSYPVVGRTVREVRAWHRESAPSSIRNARPDLSRAFAEVIDRALAGDPMARFATAEEMAAALEKLDAASADAIPGQSSWRPSGAVWLAAATAALMGVIAAFNVGGLRDQLGIRFGQPSRRPPGQPGVTDDQAFAVRRVLARGEYWSYGRPSLDGQYLPVMKSDLTLTLKNVRTGETRVIVQRTDGQGEPEDAAAISPDNRWAAYVWSTPDRVFEVRILEVRDRGPTPQPRVLLRRTDVEPSVVEWSQDGQQLLLTLEAQDGSTQVALASTFDGTLRVIKDFGLSPPLGLSLSPDARYLAYSPLVGSPQTRDIYVMATDGTGEWPLVQSPAGDMFPYWLPSGQQVLFTSDRTGALGLWTIPVVDGKPVGDAAVLNRDMGRMSPVGPTRDGAFFYRFETGLVDVYTAAVDQVTGVTGKPQPVSPNRIGSNISSDWSPDGVTLAYVKIHNPAGAAQGDPYSRTLSIRNVDTGSERDLRPALAFFIAPRWAPDGRSILVDGNDLSRRRGLHRVDVTTQEVTPYLLAEAGSTGPGRPDWSPDGKALWYARRPSGLMSFDAASGQEATVVDIRSFGVHHFTGPEMPFGVSPDGRSIAFTGVIDSGTGGQTVLDVMQIGGTPIERLRSSEPLVFQCWTPDGLDILFTRPSPQSSVDSLWRMPASGGNPRPLGLEMRGLRDVHINRDGTRLTFTAGGQGGEVRVMEHFIPSR